MYNVFRKSCERLLRIPADPHPPPGDETRTRVYRAARNYYRYLLFIWAAGSLAAILPLAAVTVGFTISGLMGNDFEPLGIFILGLLLLLEIVASLFCLAIIRLIYEKRWYIVTDRSLRVREGVWDVREMTVTFANIQNISISQGPIQRLLAIADLRVDTAGGGGGGSSPGQHHKGTNLHTAWFRGIDNANEVRDLIQQRLRQWKDSGLGDHDDLTHGATAAATAPDFLAALREVHAEAQALHRATANS